MAETELPTTLLEAVRYFADLDVCTEFVAKLRWPTGPACPRCGDMAYSYLTTRRLWKCKGCKRQYSVKVGTIFEDSALGLDKWLPAIWLIANSKNGISSHELARALGITQKSAWFMLHRIRLAMQTGTFEKLSGEVEADETYVGGKSANMHKVDRERRGIRTGGSSKAIVLGVLERGGAVRTTIVGNVGQGALQGNIRDNVEAGATVYTDALRSYLGLSDEYKHEIIDHSVQYVMGNVHTNGIENFWSLLKRGLHGTYVSVDPAHLFRYVDERAFTFNLRDLTDLGRFATLLGQVAGLRLTYETLIAHS